jgi:hypothetical protein
MLYPLYKKLKNNEKGSFIIEASLIFPIIFFIIIGVLYLSIYIYENVQLYSYANKAANRISYVWTNSHMDIVTGELDSPGASDGLYWRLTDDQLLGELFGTGGSNSAVTIGAGSGGDLASRKLSKITGSALSDSVSGKVFYENDIAEKRVVVELNKNLPFPNFVEKVLNSDVKVKASATITDPVEFIRTVELIKVYATELKDNLSILQKQKANE